MKLYWILIIIVIAILIITLSIKKTIKCRRPGDPMQPVERPYTAKKVWSWQNCSSFGLSI